LHSNGTAMGIIGIGVKKLNLVAYPPENREIEAIERMDFIYKIMLHYYIISHISRYLYYVVYYIGSRGSSVSIVSDYGLDGHLGVLVVSVLATGPKGCGFEPGQGNGFLRVIKIRSTPSSRMGSRAGRYHVVRFYGM
jgi:hypothetical protein